METPEIGDYVVTYDIDGRVLSEGFVEYIYSNLIKIKDNQFMISYYPNYGDYVIKKELLNTEIGKLIYGTDDISES